MQKLPLLLSLASFLATLPLPADQPVEAPGPAPKKPLSGLTKDSCPGVDHVVVKGGNPQIVYIPILHDNPQHRVAARQTIVTIEENLSCCRKIAEQLHQEYGIRNVLSRGSGRNWRRSTTLPSTAAEPGLHRQHARGEWSGPDHVRGRSRAGPRRPVRRAGSLLPDHRPAGHRMATAGQGCGEHLPGTCSGSAASSRPAP